MPRGLCCRISDRSLHHYSIVDLLSYSLFIESIFMCGSRGGDRGSGSLKNHKNIGYLSNSLDPLKITKLPSQHSMLGHHQHTSETPFKFAGGSMMARLWWYLDPPSSHQLKKEKKRKNNVAVGPPDKAFYIRACILYSARLWQRHHARIQNFRQRGSNSDVVFVCLFVCFLFVFFMMRGGRI